MLRYRSATKNMKILVKFPTRARPSQFLKTLTGYKSLSTNDSLVHYLVSIDKDDLSMQNSYLTNALIEMNNVSVSYGFSENKIHAINRDIEKIKDWDVLVLGCDDMICQVQGWDDILRNEMFEHFTDLDGVLWHSDGYVHERLNTLPIIGRKYYERFNYIYNPSYTSLWADNEFMEVANGLGKQKYFPECLFRHEHFSNNRTIRPDALMKKNESYFKSDQQVYEKRKAINFEL